MNKIDGFAHFQYEVFQYKVYEEILQFLNNINNNSNNNGNSIKYLDI